MTVDKTERRIAGEKLHQVGVIGHVIKHEIYRCFKGAHKSGLTPKEQALLDRTERDLAAVLENITKVGERCRK